MSFRLIKYEDHWVINAIKKSHAFAYNQSIRHFETRYFQQGLQF